MRVPEGGGGCDEGVVTGIHEDPTEQLQEASTETPLGWPMRLLLVAATVAAVSLLGYAVGRNIHMLRFRNALLGTPSPSAQRYTLYGRLDANSGGGTWPGDPYPVSLVGRWSAGRAFLARGEPSAAADVLLPIRSRAARNTLLYHDLMCALSHSENWEAVISLYEDIPAPETRAVADMVALAYLGRQAPGDLQRVRGHDLFAALMLWRQADTAGDTKEVAVQEAILKRFSADAILPQDRRLSTYVRQAIPDLLAEGVWDRDVTRRVVAAMVWQVQEEPSTEALLDELISLEPGDAEWRYRLAELYHRGGQLGRAEAAYRRCLDLDPAHHRAWLGLAQLAEIKGDHVEAADHYTRYRSACPEDLLCLASLISARANAGLPPDERLATELRQRTDPRLVLADMLEVSPETVELGGDLLVPHPTADPLDGWTWSDTWVGDRRNDALFVGGLDDLGALEQSPPLRIDGLWVDQRPTLERARAGYQSGTFDLAADTWYMMSIVYRTDSSRSDARVWVSAGGGSPPFREYRLPDTEGQWRLLVMLAQSGSRQTQRRAYLRNWGAGVTEFGPVELRQISLGPGTTERALSPKVELR